MPQCLIERLASHNSHHVKNPATKRLSGTKTSSEILESRKRTYWIDETSSKHLPESSFLNRQNIFPEKEPLSHESCWCFVVDDGFGGGNLDVFSDPTLGSLWINWGLVIPSETTTDDLVILYIYISHRIHVTGIFTYIFHENQPNVGKCTIHGSYGIYTSCHKYVYKYIYIYIYTYTILYVCNICVSQPKSLLHHVCLGWAGLLSVCIKRLFAIWDDMWNL